MNFFQHQDTARQRTGLLLLLMLAAVLVIVGVTIVATLVFAVLALPLAVPLIVLFELAPPPPAWLGWVSAAVLATIAYGTLREQWRLRDGGDAVARMAGGRLISTATESAGERRLLNVIAEMALAAGVAQPKAYVLDGEPGINAFAAGFGPNQAVIAVTDGALLHLTRPELQGVIAHEFSHILNGDMRLNMQLMAAVSGIGVIGEWGEELRHAELFSGSHHPLRNFGFLRIGAGYTLQGIGAAGVLATRLIKSAVSRQREYLADASAIQFTRDPDTIGRALRKVRGFTKASTIQHWSAEHLSHLYFGAVGGHVVDGWLATHPPLPERIERIYGQPMPALQISAETRKALAQRDPGVPLDMPAAPIRTVRYESSAEGRAAAGPVLRAAPEIGRFAPEAPGDMALLRVDGDPLPFNLAAAAAHPHKVLSLALALLRPANEQEASSQCQAVLDGLDSAARPLLGPALDGARALRAELKRLDGRGLMALVDLATPALQQRPAVERQQLLQAIDLQARADGRVSLGEFVIQIVLERRLSAEANRAIKVRYRSVEDAAAPVQMVLSLLAHVAGAAAARHAGVLPEQRGQRAADAAAQVLQAGRDSLHAAGQALPPDRATLLPATELSFDAVRDAVRALNQLAPMPKAMLAKALAAASAAAPQGRPAWEANAPVRHGSADVLRALCGALDIPLPVLHKS